MQIWSRLCTLLLGLAALTGCPAQGQDYDRVILNGRVMDPASGLDEVRNVGITDGKITVVTAACKKEVNT